MNKYDNHIYLIICEISIDLFGKSKCTTFSGYCGLMAQAINSDTLSITQKKHIGLIFDILYKIFGLGSKETAVYINEFFMDKKFLKLEKVIMLTKDGITNLESIINITV